MRLALLLWWLVPSGAHQGRPLEFPHFTGPQWVRGHPPYRAKGTRAEDAIRRLEPAAIHGWPLRGLKSAIYARSMLIGRAPQPRRNSREEARPPPLTQDDSPVQLKGQLHFARRIGLTGDFTKAPAVDRRVRPAELRVIEGVKGFQPKLRPRPFAKLAQVKLLEQ